MALAFLLEFPGVTQEQYDKVLEKLQLGGKTYQGGIFHVAGPMEGGWRVVDVWESEEACAPVLVRGKSNISHHAKWEAEGQGSGV